MTQASVATKEFEATAAASTGATATASKAASTFGTVSKLAFTGAAVGAALFAKQAFETATAFNKSFTRIAALTDTPDAALQHLRETVMGLSGETAQSPVELADALYFLASAGLDSQQQMEALDATAKGMAVGLGEGADLARITAQALNVFGDSGLKAAGVMDVLIAAVREGSAEPAEFADALGRVLPIADKAGISFNQVAASLATMSNAGLDVHEGVTALRAILQSLVSPTAQTVSAFDRVGLSVDDVVQSMKGEGLISTLRMVDQAARDNTGSTGEYNMLMRKLIPNIRGLAGAFNLTGQDAKKVDKIFQAVLRSGGALDDSFATTAESSAFKMQQALQEISNAGTQLAGDVLPAIASALSAVAVPLTDVLPLAAKLGAVWLGYKALSGIASVIDTLTASHVRAAAAQVTAAATATELSVAEADAAVAAASFATAEGAAADSMVLYVANARGAVVAAREVAAAQGEAAAAGGAAAGTAGKGLFAGALAGATGFLTTVAAVGVVGHHMFDSILKGADDTANEFQITEDQAASLQERVSHGALMGGQGGILHWLADPLATAGAKTEEAASKFQQLESELQAAGIGMDDINKSFQANTGLLNANRASIDPWIEAIKQGALKSAGLDQATLDLNASVEKQQAAWQAAAEKTHGYQQSVADLTAPLGQLETVGLDVNGFLTDFRGQLEESKNPMATFNEGIDSIMASMADWRSQAAEQLTGIGDLLSTLAQDTNTSLSDITSSFKEQAKLARSFADDLAVIGKMGEAGKTLAADLLSGGLGMAGLADTIASGPEEARKRAVSAFGGILSAGQTGASQLQRVLVPVLKDIRTILFNLAHDKWGIDLPLDDHGSQKKIDDINEGLKVAGATRAHAQVVIETTGVAQVQEIANRIDELEGGHHVVIGVHTVPESPWPDEALQAHLVDPLLKMGAKKINGLWTVPLEVGVHTSTSSLAFQKAMAAAPKGFAMAKDAVGADRYYKIMKSIKEDAHKTGELHLKALRKIIADESSSKRARAWAEAAVEAFDKRMAQADEPPPWIQNALRDVPRLPRGDTDISVNHHDSRRRRAQHGINIKLDRKIYADAMTQEVSYGRGY